MENVVIFILFLEYLELSMFQGRDLSLLLRSVA